MTVNIFFHGSVDPYDSYGLIGTQLARHFAAAGCYVNIRMRRTFKASNIFPEMQRIVDQPRRPATGGIFLGWPTIFAEHGAGFYEHPRVAVTMFESSKLPSGWAEILNDFDAVIVPGKFCYDVFRNSGVTAPIHITPLGIGEIYRPVQRERVNGSPLTFLAFVDRGWRKGGMTAINTFVKAFGDDLRYRLILKMRNPRVPFSLTNPNIVTILTDMTEKEMLDLYRSTDIMLNASRGEGFGLLPREFAATGGISLATNWGGLADDLGSWGWPLPYKLADARWDASLNDNFHDDWGQWAEPDEDGIVPILRDVALNYTSYRYAAESLAQDVADRYSWRRFSEGVLSVWESVKQGVPA